MIGDDIMIKDKVVMIDRYGDVYPAIDRLYHPNPGEANSEIERCVDWIIGNNITGIDDVVSDWIKTRVSQYFYDEGYTDDLDEVVFNVMYSDSYIPDDKTVDKIRDAMNDPNIEDYITHGEDKLSQRIADFINEKFLRVRLGGKYNNDGENAIYFRISSHGYDWRRNILDYLWNRFGDIDNMPNKIVVGHDAETNPPEKILFYGSPEDLFDGTDMLRFESLKCSSKRENFNRDRESIRLNKLFLNCSNTKNYKRLI